MATETETKVDDVKPAEVKPAVVDERAVDLANQCESAIQMSAKAESDIAASHSLETYAKAGRAHFETIKCTKASLDYGREKAGLTSSWNASEYENVVDSITRRVRATNPELFENFDAIKEKPSAPSLNRERIQARILVALVADALLPLVGEGIWRLPYRIFFNYLRAERVFSFSKTKVVGELVVENMEFLKTHLGLMVEGKSSSASFLNALKAHFDSIDRAAKEAADANLTPDQRKLRDVGKKAGKIASTEIAKVGSVKKKLAQYLGEALSGTVPPEEVAKMVSTAAKTAKVVVPIGKMNVATLTPAELSNFLQQVVTRGGATLDDRKKLILTIIRHGSELAERRQQKRDAKAAAASNGVSAMALAV